MEEKRFIVVGFNQDIGNILQRGGFMNWYIERGIKFYKRLSYAIKAAKSLKFGFDKVAFTKLEKRTRFHLLPSRIEMRK